MKQLVLALVLALFFSTSANAITPQITAQSAILIDRDSGQILYSKNPHEKRAIASTTKVLTTILAIENSHPQEQVRISPKAAEVGESTIDLEPYEKISMEGLLYGALLRSGNDACVAIAEHVAGKEEAFVEMMNKKALLLGAKQSSFKNTNGLPNEQHYSTAYDMALIASHALKNPYFSRIVSTKDTVIQNADNSSKKRYLKNTNKLLWQYAWSNGVKTGTTNKAGRCLIGSASKNGRNLVFVLLHSDDREGDGRKLFEYGFNSFVTTSLLEKGQVFGEISILENEDIKLVPVKVEDSLTVTIPKDSQKSLERKLKLNYRLIAPIKKNQTLGSYSVFLDGKQIKTVRLVAGCNVEKKDKIDLILKNLKDFL